MTLMTTRFREEIAKLSAAEEFFDFLEVPFDPHVVHVNRLHILKRLSDYMRKEETESLDDNTLRALYREKLAQAHADFVKSDAVTEKVFKVFKDAHGKSFIGLDDIEVLSIQK